ncbi:MAG: hypothetical protein QW047_07275 [Sulfolobales archaeon]
MRLLNEIVKIYSGCGLKELLNEYLEAFICWRNLISHHVTYLENRIEI